MREQACLPGEKVKRTRGGVRKGQQGTQISPQRSSSLANFPVYTPGTELREGVKQWMTPLSPGLVGEKAESRGLSVQSLSHWTAKPWG